MPGVLLEQFLSLKWFGRDLSSQLFVNVANRHCAANVQVAVVGSVRYIHCVLLFVFVLTRCFRLAGEVGSIRLASSKMGLEKTMDDDTKKRNTLRKQVRVV